MDFSKINGFEFEEYIATLFTNKGFQVQRTNYAHDGGIDLIAVYNEPLFCGKYIVQCKKYEDALVGQPVIRDLYGVVMSENANKGILITTSDFTEEARSFAKNKNLELIDGNLLKKIISNTDNACENEITIEGFNSDRYTYLMDKINENHSTSKYYEEAISFLKEYVISDASFVETLGLLDKIVDLNQQLIRRCYKKKADNFYRKVCWLRIAEIEMLKGNLGEAVNILVDNNAFYIKSWIPKNVHRISLDNHAPIEKTRLLDIETRNLFSISQELGLHELCSIILSKYSLQEEIAKEKRFMCESWYLLRLKNCEEAFEQFVSPNVSNQFIFSKPSATSGKYASIIYPEEDSNTYVDVRNIVSKYKKTCTEIKEDIMFALKQHNINI